MTAVIGDFSAAKVRGESCWRKDWRREWDSNPRYGFPYTRFPSERLQPLGHLSGAPLMTVRETFIKGEGGRPQLTWRTWPVSAVS